MNVQKSFCALMQPFFSPENCPEYFDKTSGIPEKSFLHTEKPLVVSTDSVGKPDSEEIEKIGMKAVMIFPILKQESGNMVLSLNHRRQGHVWSMAEIKFTSDAVKILQSIQQYVI